MKSCLCLASSALKNQWWPYLQLWKFQIIMLNMLEPLVEATTLTKLLYNMCTFLILSVGN